MKKIILSIIFILMTVAFISLFGDNAIPEKNQTILEKQAKEYGPQIEWIPSKAQTSRALVAIYNFLKKEITPEWRNNQRKIIQDQLSSYHVQFAGILIDHQRVIHCNFFPVKNELNHDKRSYVFVLDGGASYWRINYDLKNDRCFGFEVNGEA